MRMASELDHLEDQRANDHITEDIYEHDYQETTSIVRKATMEKNF